MNQDVDSTRTYRIEERPEVWVEVDGDWFDGDLYSWSRTDDGWTALVRWGSPDGSRLGRFLAERVYRADYCPWFRGESECRFACERGA